MSKIQSLGSTRKIDNTKIALFDIDYTLFNTKRFRFRLYNGVGAVLQKKQGKKLSQKVYADIREELDYFDSRMFVQKLSQHVPKKEDAKHIEEALWSKKNFYEGLYAETKNTLKKLLERGIPIGIFSKGETRFQRAKLISIEDLLTEEHIHITLNKHTSLPKLIDKYKGKRIFLIDDALDVLYKAHELDPSIFTIWVKRGKFAKKQEPIFGFTPNATVLNLRTVTRLITEN